MIVDMMRAILLYVIRIVEFLLFLRAILSWIPMRAGQLHALLYQLTEPLLAPARRFLMRFSWARGTPIDLSWLLVYVLLEMVRYILLSIR